jgi:hypothetical protein
MFLPLFSSFPSCILLRTPLQRFLSLTRCNVHSLFRSRVQAEPQSLIIDHLDRSNLPHRRFTAPAFAKKFYRLPRSFTHAILDVTDLILFLIVNRSATPPT